MLELLFRRVLLYKSFSNTAVSLTTHFQTTGTFDMYTPLANPTQSDQSVSQQALTKSSFLVFPWMYVSYARDRTVKFWDTRTSNPAAVVSLCERAYSMDTRGAMMVVATADRKVGPSNKISRSLVQPCVTSLFNLISGVSEVGIDFLPFCFFFYFVSFFFCRSRFDVSSGAAF